MHLMLKTFALVLFVVNMANAQHSHSGHEDVGGSGHTHKAEPPHGGEIKDIGKYHLEILFDITAPIGERMSIYILKSNFKTVDVKGASGRINVKYKDGTEENHELNNNNVDKLYCDVKNVANSFNASIIILYKGKEYSCTYYYKGMK